MSMMQRRFYFLSFVLVISMSCPAFAGKLDDVRQEIKKPASSKPKNLEAGADAHGGSSEPLFDWSSNENAFEQFFMTLMVVTSPFWAPYQLCEHKRWKSDPGFLDWPYQDGADGYGTDALDGDRALDGFAGRLHLGAGFASWGQRYVGDLRIAFDNRFDLHLTGFVLVEPIDQGKNDYMYFFEPGVSWLFALGDRAQFRLGAELVLVASPNDAPAPGVTATYAIDWFPVEPIVFTFEFAAGVLGEQFYGHSEMTVGLVWGPIEPFVGYEARFVGSQYLGTGSAGLRIWF